MKKVLSTLLLLMMVMDYGHATAAAGDSRPYVNDGEGVSKPRISLVTCAPGREIYQLEGHEALRIELPGGVDIAVNWGVFDFNSPNFVYRFVKGETDYMAVAVPMEVFLQEYRREGRRVVSQTINLDSLQTARLMQLVSENLEPQNCTYRYNYVKDNCATRPLAMIEQAAGMPIEFEQPDGESLRSFRSEMTRYHHNYPWYQFGIDIALGSGIDIPVSTRELSFAPVMLERLLRRAWFVSNDGERRPVVSQTAVLIPGVEAGTQLDATPWPLTPISVGATLLTICVVFSIADMRRKKLTRWLDTLLFGAQFLAGCLLTFLIFVSSHEATSPNWLYLWLNPLCIIPAVCVWIKSCKRVVYFYQICNFAVLIVLLVAHNILGQAMNAAFPLFILCALSRSATEIYLYHPRFRHLDWKNKIN